MPKFGERSLGHLKQLHPLLQKVMNEAIQHYDFSIIESYRDKAAQNKAFKEGKSKAKFGQSAHNYKPAVAVDCVPYPLDWNNTTEFNKMGAQILAAAEKVGVPIRWGKYFTGLVDMPHFELHPWKDYIKK